MGLFKYPSMHELKDIAMIYNDNVEEIYTGDPQEDDEYDEETDSDDYFYDENDDEDLY